jgi:hypothetical protein
MDYAPQRWPPKDALLFYLRPRLPLDDDAYRTYTPDIH